MIKKLIYFLLRAYVKFGLWFYFKEIRVVGSENIPKNKPVIFLPNHQNAFLDALVLVTHNGRTTHFVARADVFSSGFVKWLLSLINLMPIYRIRDGWQALGKNEAIFNQCFAILKKGEALMMFPEGNHGHQRRLRPLSKGFTRVAFGAQQIDLNTDIYLIPTGLNYTAPKKYRSSVSVYYGEPILVKDFYKSGEPQEANQLRMEVSKQMKKLITHVEDEANYDTIISAFENKGQHNYLDPIVTNKQLDGSIDVPTDKAKSKTIFSRLLHPVALLNNCIVIVFWKMLRTKIKDPVFIGSLKFAFGISLAPLIYLVQVVIVFLLVGVWWTTAYLLFTLFIAAFVSKK